MPTTTTPGAPGRATRCWTLVGATGAVDVAVTADDEDEVAAVLPALELLLGRPVDGLWSGPSRLPGRTPLRTPELAHGAVLGLGRPGPRTDRGSALELHVVAGPEAGRTLPLGSGRHVLGRGSGATVALEDPDVSRCHVAVTVGRGRITVADLGSTNGSRVADDVLTTEPRTWPAGTVLRLGATALIVRGATGPAAASSPGPGGRAVLRPVPRLDRPPPGERAGTRPAVADVVFPRPPEPAPRRRLSWVAVVLPAVAGVLMAWLLDAPTFLFFALLGPAVALGTWLGERWSGRRGARRAGAEHEVERAAAEARLAVAVRSAVSAADAAHPDPAALATAARRRTPLLWSRTGADGDALTVRLGTGPGDTGVTRVDGSGAREPQVARHLPVVLDLAGGGGLTVVGPAECTGGVLRSVVCQLAVLLPPGWWHLLLLCSTEGTGPWRWARWLPHLDPAAVHLGLPGPLAGPDEDGLVTALTQVAAGHGTARASPNGAAPEEHRPRAVVLVDRPVGPRLAAALRAARGAGLVVLTRGSSPAAAPVVTDTVLELCGETGTAGRLSRRGVADVRVDVVDRVPVPTAARVARDLAGLRSGPAATALPRAVRLLDLPSPGVRILDDGTLAGVWSARRDQLRTGLGRSAEGSVLVDLCADGPHALVAGTTGSGKSELLQSLIAGLAMAHPPRRCSFLLVDYKGGAAFGEAAALPHTVGVLTDLDGQSTARALRSLTAELTRRERVLAAHRVADLAELPDEVELARLVIVVDEFATLADELPSFVPGLVSIAQRGRSLGVHLVLATQRPAGVVSPEIRANCSLRICLRTTDESDSLDVVGTPAAASLPVDLPGRAYLRSGNGPPVAVQVGRVAGHRPAPGSGTAGPRGTGAPAVDVWTWPATPGPPPAAPSDETDLARICRLLAAHALDTGTGAPHRPWQPPLPDHLELTDGSATATAGTGGAASVVARAGGDRPAGIVLGLVDLPDDQSRRPLELDLDDGGTWLAVGGPRSGRSTLLRSVLREAVSRLPADHLHVHLIESGGGALGAELVGLPHAGTVVSGADRFRTARLVERLGAEIAARRAGPERTGAPRLLLLVDGVEELGTLLEEALPGTGSATLARLLRDGPAAGLTSVVTADRAVPGGRLAALAGYRLVLPLADRADYAVAGVAPGAVPAHRPPGRALVGEDALECQLAVPCATSAPLTAPARQGRIPLTIPALPPDPVLPLGTCAPATDPAALVLAVGPGGDEGHPIAVDLRRTGGLLVAGPPGSGRTTALDAFAAELAHRGVEVLRLGGRPAGTSAPTAGAGPPAGATALEDWLRELQDAPGVLLLDDVPAPADLPVLGVLSRPGARVALVAAGQAADLATHYQGPVAALRRARTGLLLQPGPGDGDLLGARLPRLPVPARPGSGWLVEGGGVHRVQVARRRPGHADRTTLTGPR